jgi:catechol 2,3-dioxygenase-like lactoylglutathione lyase family enzyme
VEREEEEMKINLTSVLVDDQDKALKFYTDVLGFVKKTEIPMGEHRWITVVSPHDPDGIPSRHSPWRTSRPKPDVSKVLACVSRKNCSRWAP